MLTYYFKCIILKRKIDQNDIRQKEVKKKWNLVTEYKAMQKT